MRSTCLRFVAATVFALLSVAVDARVLSYAAYSSRPSVPAVQNRLNRHFVTQEYGEQQLSPVLLISPPIFFSPGLSQVVVYDSEGKEEPRIVFPSNPNTQAEIYATAAFESGDGQLSVLVVTTALMPGESGYHGVRALLSVDGGTTWKVTATPLPSFVSNSVADNGGPFTRWRGSSVRIGSSDYPFVIYSQANGGDSSVWAVARDASARQIATVTIHAIGPLAGMSPDGRYAIVRTSLGTLTMVDMNGAVIRTASVDPSVDAYEAWSTPALGVYAEGWSYNGMRSLAYVSPNGVTTTVLPWGLTLVAADGTNAGFSVPTSDYNGAWMIRRGNGQATSLYRFTPETGLVKQWSDVSAPEVEAVHAAKSGQRLLIQVHRPRLQADQRLFKDPALAIWEVGTTAPDFYDELFLDETDTKGFVHLDVDAVAAGGTFVFDSGSTLGYGNGGGVIISPAPVGGGADVTQEWGIVRASLAQRLVVPGVARLAGAYGSFWKTDLVFYNPASEAVTMTIRYVPNGEVQTADLKEISYTVNAHETRAVADSMKALFNYETAGGALYITPKLGQAVAVTSRTYSSDAHGTFGMGFNAIDLNAASSSRFPATFAGAFLGNDFRTNLLITDVGGRGTYASVAATGSSGVMGRSDVAFGAVANGQQQVNGLAPQLGLLPSDTGSLVFQPLSGEAVASLVAIDNRTNDPTYFPPDLPSPVVRTIPIIGHVDGANNSKFRSDLYLYNVSSTPRTVTLQVTMWDTTSVTPITLTLLPYESKVIRDVLFTAFGRTGVARLRYQSSGDTNGVRATSRIYTIDPATGGTYGFLMPPLNNFQSAGAGDTLEIIGAIGAANFRTNLALVDLTGFANGQSSRVKVDILDEKQNVIDSFITTVPSAGGLQIDDLFRARNLGDGPKVSVIRVTSSGSIIGAFATMIDNGTNDPTYLAATLAAQ